MEDNLLEGSFTRDECVIVHVYSIKDENHVYLRIPSMRIIMKYCKFPFMLTPLVLEEKYCVYESTHYTAMIPKSYIRAQLISSSVWKYGSHHFKLLKNQKYQCYGFYATDCVVLSMDDEGYFDIDPDLRIMFVE